MISSFAILATTISGCWAEKLSHEEMKGESGSIATVDSGAVATGTGDDSVVTADTARGTGTDVINKAGTGTIVGEEMAIDIADKQTCEISNLGISLRFPEKWGKCKEVGDSIMVQTDHDPWIISFMIHATKNDQYTVQKYKVERRKGTYYEQTNGGEIFKLDWTDHVGGMNGAILDGDVYKIDWFIYSDQPGQGDGDGRWVPLVGNATEQFAWEILKTIKKTDKGSGETVE